MAPPTQPTSPNTETILDATQTIFDRLLSVLADITKTLGKTFDVAEDMNQGFTANLRLQMIRDYGGEIAKVTTEQFQKGDFSKIVNEGEQAVIRSLRNMDSYMKDLQVYEGLDPAQIETNRQTLLKEFGDFNINLLKKNNAEIEKQSMLFSKSLNISLGETANLIKINFAKTGDASTKILTEITNNAKTVGDAAGIPIKVMADGIAEVMTDMKTFTDITVQSAARMTAKLSQLGLSLDEFRTVLEPFRDFDSAATKIGDLSAMFGVQMDAMEMMYLSNENEEEFLNRFREQILDQGIDVETMSKTRQRALASQLGMSIAGMKMFLNSQMSYTEASELAAATGEAAGKTQADAQTEIEKGLLLAVRNSKELTDATIASQAVLRTFDVSNFTQEIGKFQKALIGAAGDQNKFNQILNQITSYVNSGAGKAAGFATAGAELARKSIPQIGEAEKESAKANLTAGFEDVANTVAEGVNNVETATARAQSGSWPEIFVKMADGFGSDKEGKPNAQMQFYIKTINQWSDTLSKAAADGVAKIAQSFDLAKLSTNFQLSAQVATDQMTSAIQKLPRLDRIEGETNEVFAARLKQSLSDQNINFAKMTEAHKKILADQYRITVQDLNTTASIPAATTPATTTTVASPAAPATAAPAVAAAAVEVEKATSLREESSPVKFDTENLKKEIIEAIKDGFAAGNYGFNLSLDGKSIATSLQLVKDNAGRRIQFVG